jgi:hypothetical protein
MVEREAVYSSNLTYITGCSMWSRLKCFQLAIQGSLCFFHFFSVTRLSEAPISYVLDLDPELLFQILFPVRDGELLSFKYHEKMLIHKRQ